MLDYQIDREYWNKLSLFEQLGNVSSEVGRSIKAHRSGKTSRESGAIDRALDLIDATVACLIDKKDIPRAREVLRSREEYCRLFFDDTFDEDADAIEKYFMQFALAARQ